MAATYMAPAPSCSRSGASALQLLGIRVQPEAKRSRDQLLKQYLIAFFLGRGGLGGCGR